MNASKPLVLLGAGGHAKVLISLARAAGFDLFGVCDPTLSCEGQKQWRGLRVMGGDDVLDTLDPESVGMVNGIGQLVAGNGRRRIFENLKSKGFHFPILVHPTAWVDDTSILREGVQIMAGAIIQADVIIGENSIVNTKAGIDHDCRLGAHVHVAPGATLCGGVHVRDHAFVGSGATVIQGVAIGEGAVVGAGAVLVRDLAARQILLSPVARKKSALRDD